MACHRCYDSYPVPDQPPDEAILTPFYLGLRTNDRDIVCPEPESPHKLRGLCQDWDGLESGEWIWDEEGNNIEDRNAAIDTVNEAPSQANDVESRCREVLGPSHESRSEDGGDITDIEDDGTDMSPIQNGYYYDGTNVGPRAHDYRAITVLIPPGDTAREEAEAAWTLTRLGEASSTMTQQ